MSENSKFLDDIAEGKWPPGGRVSPPDILATEADRTRALLVVIACAAREIADEICELRLAIKESAGK